MCYLRPTATRRVNLIRWSRRTLLVFSCVAPGVAALPLCATTLTAGFYHSATVEAGVTSLWGQLRGPLASHLVGAPSTTSVTAGASHTLLRDADGRIWCVGDNSSRQCGPNGGSTFPVVATPFADALGMAAGLWHSIVLRADGTVWSWGTVRYGSLGDGTTLSSATPVNVAGLAGVVAVASSLEHTLALTSDGHVWGWGNNLYAQLGDGTRSTRATPVQVVGLSDVVAIVAAYYHSLALKSDGTVWAWGNNYCGTLGDGTQTLRVLPVQVQGLANVVAIAAGEQHNLAVLSDGSVRSWGVNNHGQLGDGTQTCRLVPTDVPGLSGITQVAAGKWHSLAATADGRVWAWGNNQFGQLGDGTTIRRLAPVSLSETGLAWRAGTPVFVPDGGVFTTNQTVAVTTATAGATIRYTLDGSEPSSTSDVVPTSGMLTISASAVLRARTWRTGQPPSNIATTAFAFNFGTLASPTFDPPAGAYVAPLSVALYGPADATVRYTLDGSVPNAGSAMATGPLRLDTSGTLRAAAFKPDWTSSPMATAAYDLQAPAPTVAPGSGTYEATVLATLSNTLPWLALYYTTDGSLPTSSSPTLASGASVTVDRSMTLRASAAGTGLRASNVTEATYSLVVASPQASPSPGWFRGLVTVSLASATPGATLRFTTDGSEPLADSPVYSSPLAFDGSTLLRVRAFKTGWTSSDVRSFSFARADDSGSLVGGQAFSAAVDPAGRVWTWGANASGQLGDDSTIARPYVARVPGLDAIVALAAGDEHLLALRDDGRVWALGANDFGQLGLGTTGSVHHAQLIPGLAGIVAIAAGARHSLAVDASGRVWAFGDNSAGQLGVAGLPVAMSPTLVAGLTGSITTVAAGAGHSLALSSTGALWAWGDNTKGQLGLATLSSSATPNVVPGLPALRALAAGARHTLAIAVDGGVWAWGDNSHLQLARGDDTPTTVPGRVWAVTCATNGCSAAALLTGVASVAAGEHHSLAGGADGSSWGWGAADAGRLFGAPEAALARRLVDLDVRAVGAGAGHSMVVTATGEVWAAGSNSAGQLGIGQRVDASDAAQLSESGFAWRTTPVDFNPQPGEFLDPPRVELATAMPGASIRYTLDGSDPAVSGTPFALPGFELSASGRVRARAFLDGFAPSVDTGADYVLRLRAPALGLPSGEYDAPPVVSVTAPASDATLHYTLSSSLSQPREDDPQVASGGSVTVVHSAALWVRAFKPGWAPGDAQAIYRLAAQPPAIVPPGGHFAGVQEVTLTSTTPGARIHYTTDGGVPDDHAPFVYSGARVRVARPLRLRAVARADGLEASRETEGTFAFDAASLRLVPPPGTYAGPVTVAVAGAAPGTSVRYTLDGSEPTASSRVYQRPLLIEQPTQLRVRAFTAGWQPGPTSGGLYDVPVPVVMAPRFQPDGGVHATWQRVRLICETPGTLLRYTTDGRPPTLTDSPAACDDTIDLARTATLAVRAWAADLSDASAVRSAPYVITGSVSAGDGFALALRADGTAVAWGENTFGQLGNGTVLPSSTPTPVSGIDDVVALSAGWRHALALRRDGTVWAWGANDVGQVGDGSFVARHSPVSVTALADVVAISAGEDRSLALVSDGSVWAWGENAQGHLGVGAVGHRSTPVRVVGADFTDIAAISAGRQHGQALDRQGRLWGWGDNFWGQADGNPSWTLMAPSVAADFPSLAAISAHGGQDVFPLHGSLGLAADGAGSGRIVRWGRGLSFVEASPHEDFVALDTGIHDLGVRQDRSLWDLDTGARVGLADVAVASAGTTQSLAVTFDGRVWAWAPGDNPHALAGLTLTAAGNAADEDGDGLDADTEVRLGTNPYLADTNGDGLSDGAAVALGLSATDLDVDADGVANALELARGTDPWRADSDGDGVLDGVDCFPSSAALVCPAIDAQDTTPPTITLLWPVGAALVSSQP